LQFTRPLQQLAQLSEVLQPVDVFFGEFLSDFFAMDQAMQFWEAYAGLEFAGIFLCGIRRSSAIFVLHRIGSVPAPGGC
jgi:hypothetical protein